MGNIYATGAFSGTADFDPGPDVVNRTSAGNRDIFILQLTQAPAGTTEVALSGSDLTITDIDGGDTDDTLTLSVAGTDLVVSDPNNLITTSIAGATGDGTNTVTVPLAAFTGDVLVNTLAGDDVIDVAGLTGLPGGLTIDGGADTDTVNFTGTVNLANESLNVTADTITVSAAINSGGGDVNLTATNGVTVNADIDSGGGQVTVNADSDGDGDGAFTLTEVAVGTQFVNWTAVDTIANTATGTLPGGITVTATGTDIEGIGPVGSAFTGPEFSPEQTSGNFVRGQYFNPGDFLTLTLSSPVSNPFLHFRSLQSIGGTTPVDLIGFNLTPTKVSGTSNWDINGNAIRHTSGNPFSGHRGTLQFTGSVSSLITTRVDPAFFSGGDSVVFNLGFVSTAGSISSAGGNVSITAADAEIGGSIDAAAGTVSFVGSTAGRTFDLGDNSGTGQFVLTDDELDNVTTTDKIVVGDSTAGKVTITAAISPANASTLEINSGATIGDTNTTTPDVTIGQLTMDGTVGPGASPGIMSVVGNFSFADNDTFDVEIGGTSPGNTATDHDQLDATGSVTIGANVALVTSSFNSFVPTAGQQFEIINRSGGSGTFDGLAEGATLSNFLGSGLDATITYAGGDGDDVVLEVVTSNAPPAISPQSFNIDENQTAVGTVVATDADLPGDTLTFSISGGLDASLFSITANGALSFNVAPDFETPLDDGGNNVYDLQVTVTDDSGESDAANVTVNFLNLASITGSVFVDVNENGLFDANEPGIDGVLMELHDEFGDPVLDDLGDAIAATTSDGGFYLFEDLDPGIYQIFENQPTGVDDGLDLLGSLGGAVIANDTMQLTLDRTDAFDYIFAELGQGVASGDTATIGFWQNKNGQSLIRQGGTDLASWLTSNFGNVFGSTFSDGSGGDDGAEVASFFKSELFRQKGKKSAAGPAKVDAQFMAVALATYFTSSNLAGTVAASYGFNVTDTGIGTKIVNVGVNVGDNGAAFGVVNGIDLTIMQLLSATNALTDTPNNLTGAAKIYDTNGDGVIDAAEAALRVQANAIFSAINEDGDI